MNENSIQGEVIRNAQRLVKYRGQGALGYSKMMVERMIDEGDEQDQAYWIKISRQVELLVQENG